MARRSGLGKGLGALIPPTTADTAAAYQELPVGAVRPNPNQPRSSFDEESMASLTASIREVGILQPVLVRPVDDGEYELVAGEVRKHFGEKVCRVIVPRTVRLSEAPSFGQPVIVFDSSSRGAIAYRELAKEVSGGTPQRAR